MNEAEIANRFIRAAEIDRAQKEHVGPAPVRSMPLPYVHDHLDRAGWRKEAGDKLEKGDDPLEREQIERLKRLEMTPTAAELSAMDGLYDLLMLVRRGEDRRALWAWARSKAGGKSFRSWCFKIEHIHPETGRKRKNRALAQIVAGQASAGKIMPAPDKPCEQVEPVPRPQPADLDDDDDSGRRSGPNRWATDDAFRPFLTDDTHDFSWAARRNERRRERAKKKAAQEANKAVPQSISPPR